ncbi:hypothetical protein Nepgr_015506 [Nepenthes gracilis]|uniref:Filament-like plant protein 4 n=1 Tax=Nepenthes gracilis TaxID=150966 RepID=A0AAD3XRL7_NEPGR|nr:hypothetical protein Nepgr_015506 [Nepenthes gracilis]
MNAPNFENVSDLIVFSNATLFRKFIEQIKNSLLNEDNEDSKGSPSPEVIFGLNSAAKFIAPRGTKYFEMDRLGWPWKKKSSDRTAAEKAISILDSAGVSAGSPGYKDNFNKPNYVQIPVDSYTHLTRLEDQVKAYEKQVKTYEDQFKTLEEQIDELNEKLSASHIEITNKDGLVKQHAKVAEEAVLGWEKAEAEALALKNHLESVTLAKLTAEDRAAHLDGAVKECMWQIRNLKDENEQKLQEVVMNKNKQCDKIKLEMEAKIANLDQEILRADAENAALSRLLQDRSNVLVKINEEKSQAEAMIELLKSNIESCEREINSLKYEFSIVSKELEIRNEEKNMSAKCAEVANKQHMEGVKKIAKLEAECQRLRGLVRKKLPGPAALAQMKLEVDSLGRDYGETRLRSPVKPDSSSLSQNPPLLPLPEFSIDGVQKLQKETEFLTGRLLTMEEETKMLKEALAKRNTELQALRSMHAKTASKLQSLERQMQLSSKRHDSAKADIQIPTAHSLSNHPSTTSMSEDGNDDTGSCADSWVSKTTENAKNLELMVDFLEMEKLAGLSNVSNGVISTTDYKGPESLNQVAHGNAATDIPFGRNFDLDLAVNPSCLESFASNCDRDTDPSVAMQLRSRISKVLESINDDMDIEKIIEEIKFVMREVHITLHPHPVNCICEERHCSDGNGACPRLAFPEDAGVALDKEISLPENSKASMQTKQIMSQELVSAVSQVYYFGLSLGKEAMAVHGMSGNGEDGLNHTIELFSASFNSVSSSETSLTDFVLALSNVIAKASKLGFTFLGYKGNEAEANNLHCIDKVALLENKTPQGERCCNGCSHVSDSSSNPEISEEVNIVAGFDSASYKCFLEEFDQLKAEKDKLQREMKDLEAAKCELKETEQLLAEVKLQLSSSQKMNSLAETRLKCMAESYKMLEKHAEDLETEVNLLRTRVECLDTELQAEKKSHQDALSICKELEEQLQRNEGCVVCSSSGADIDIKSKQEKEFSAAAEKLAECQETISLLGKQLKALHPKTELIDSPLTERNQKGEQLFQEKPTTSGMNLRDSDDHADQDSITNLASTGSGSAADIYSSPFSPSETDLNVLLRSPVSSGNLKRWPSKSGSSSASSSPTPDKHFRGFSKFFSSKGKNSHNSPAF